MKINERLFRGSTSTEDTGKKRTQRIKLSGITTVFSRFVTMGAGLISIPLTAHYLGTERFGLWLALSTLLTWVGIADLGLANSLTNALSTADGKEDREGARRITANAVFLVLSLTAIIAILLLVIHSRISWDKVFNVYSPQAIAEVDSAVLVCILIFSMRLSLSLPKRIFSGYQETYLYEGWSLVSNILAFSTLVIAINLRSSLPVLLAAFFGVASIGDLLAGFHIFFGRYKWLRPNLNDFSWQDVKWLFSAGSWFWIAQISTIAMFQTDLIIVTQLFGAEEVATYGVVLKLFNFIGTIALSFLGPLWPAYSEALARNDIAWIIKTFKRSILVSCLWSLPTGALLSIICPWIVGSWVGEDAIPSYGLILAMFLTSSIIPVAHCVGMLVNGLLEVKMAAVVWIVQGVVNIFLSIFLGYQLGSSGVALSTALCLLMFSVIFTGKKVVRKVKILHKI